MNPALIVRNVLLGLLIASPSADAYIDIQRPETLGSVCIRADTITLFKVERVSKEKGVIVFRKVKDLKGTSPRDSFREVLSSAHEPWEREHYLAWVEEGKLALMFRLENRQAIAIGEQWTVNDGAPPKDPDEMWTIPTRTEPWFLKNFCGDVSKLVQAVEDLLAGKEVSVPAMLGDRDKELRKWKGRKVTFRASLKRLDFNLERDLVPEDTK